MAEVVFAYCSSHAPMMSSARESAPKQQSENFLGALADLKRQAAGLDIQAAVFLSNEHFTNFFLENFPQICVGVGERNWGPTEEWLPIDKVWIPGHEGLANHIMRYTLDHGFDPAFSHLLELDHGIMTVYYELDETMQLPLVPIVMNCAVEPLMPLRRWYEFGRQLGAALRAFDGLERVAVVGCGGISHWIGNPRVGDIDDEFDQWFLERLERGEVEKVLDMQDAEIQLAGNGNHEIRTWVALAGVMEGVPGVKLAYEPIAPWITGMGVAQWDTGHGLAASPRPTAGPGAAPAVLPTEVD